jgi:hypothetical protein
MIKESRREQDEGLNLPVENFHMFWGTVFNNSSSIGSGSSSSILRADGFRKK